MKKRKDSIQKGEKDFIDHVAVAVLQNDTSKKHYLIDSDGLMVPGV